MVSAFSVLSVLSFVLLGNYQCYIQIMWFGGGGGQTESFQNVEGGRTCRCMMKY